MGWSINYLEGVVAERYVASERDSVKRLSALRGVNVNFLRKTVTYFLNGPLGVEGEGEGKKLKVLEHFVRYGGKACS